MSASTSKRERDTELHRTGWDLPARFSPKWPRRLRIRWRIAASRHRHTAYSIWPICVLPIPTVGVFGDCACVARVVSRAGSERRLQAAQLLSLVPVVVAGRDQGDLPRPRAGGFDLRPDRKVAELRDVPAERGVAQ